MKNIKKRVLSSILAVLMVFPVGLAGAFSAGAYTYGDASSDVIPIKSVENTKTVVKYTNGTTETFSGMIDASSLEQTTIVEKISSYEVFYNNESIMSVELKDIEYIDEMAVGASTSKAMNGYYAVSFDLPDSNKEAFLTGLTPNNLEIVQERIIDGYSSGYDFTMESIDFIDTEKTTASSDDDELCWAASASNMLHYSGWGEKAGFSTCDDIFDLFQENYYDGAYWNFGGINWFFNGNKGLPDNWLSGSEARLKDYGNSGGYLKDYAIEKIFKYMDLSENCTNISTLISDLQNGYAVSLSLGWINEDERNGGHSVTCWGYVTNNDYSENDKEHYEALIISDSDSDQQEDTNRRTAPNKLNLIHLTPYVNESLGYDSWICDGYNNGAFEYFTSLAPYSEDVEKETDIYATRSKVTDPDFYATGAYVSATEKDEVCQNNIALGETVFISPIFSNTSDVSYEGECSYNIVINDEIGSSVYNESILSDIVTSPYSEDIFFDEYAEIKGLDVGKYTATITLNDNHSVKEAFLCNNTYQFDFSVIESDFDTSSLSISTNIGPFEYYEATVDLTFDGFENTGILEVADNIALSASYYNDGEWSSWDNIYNSEDTLPTQCCIFRNGSKVKFKLSITGENISAINLISQEYDLEYSSIKATADKTNTGTYTTIEKGENSLKDGEMFAFKIVNISTVDNGDNTVRYSLHATRENGTDIPLTDEKEITVNFGEESEVFTVTSWNTDEALSGEYNISVFVEGSFGLSECSLGSLKFEEEHSLTVNTVSDVVDKYDGKISLREAVEYSKDYTDENKIITFSENVRNSDVTLDTAIIVDESIFIDGNWYDSESDNTFGVFLFGNEKTQLFDVKSKGKLTIKGVTFGYGKGENGGAISNDGGIIDIDNCRFFSNKSVLKGGAVYTNGGTVKIKNTSFKNNSSAFGGAIESEGSARVDMLNCSVFNNTSNCGTIYNNSGKLNIVSSTFTDNTINSYGDSAIISNGETTVLNCIVIGNKWSNDFSGKINVYGSYIGTTDTMVKTDDVSKIGDKESIFRVDSEGDSQWNSVIYYSGQETLHYIPQLKSEAKNGFKVSVESGKLVYFDNEENKYITNIDAVFDEIDYTVDEMGNDRAYYFGSFAVEPQPLYGDINGDEEVNIQDATLLQQYLNNEEYLTDEQLNNADINYDENVDIKDVTALQRYIAYCYE